MNYLVSLLLVLTLAACGGGSCEDAGTPLLKSKTDPCLAAQAPVPAASK